MQILLFSFALKQFTHIKGELFFISGLIFGHRFQES